MGVKGTFARPGAVTADSHRRAVSSGQQRAHFGHSRGQVGQQGGRFGGQIDAGKQIAQVRIAALPVEVQQLNAAHRQAGPLQNVKLKGHIRQMLFRFVAGGGLNFNQLPAGGRGLQNVHLDQQIIHQKSCLEERLPALG